MQLPDWFPEYAGFTGLAAVGSIARGKQWFDPLTGKFSWARFVTEASIAVGLAAVIGGCGVAWHVEVPVLCALCVGGGWLGPEPVAKFLLDKVGVKT